MITDFGKCLRKIRIENNEILKDMASFLGVTPSYLSAVENGKRNIPSGWAEILHKHYEISLEELELAIEKSAKSIQISLENKEASDKELAFVFARNFDRLNGKDKERLKNILTGKGE